MKIKSWLWLKYFIYMLIIIIAIVVGEQILKDIESNIALNFNFCLINIVMIIFYGGIGFLLGLENLMNEFKKEGSWVINLPKILWMGIPSLYFSSSLFISYSIPNILSYPVGILFNNGTIFMVLFQLILGYTITTSFYKEG
ncbi:MAG: hypothetical protein ACOWWR_10530 [Eubacteriales bacterium]